MPRLLDLFCGRWGWSKAFAAHNWECVGVDLVEPPEIPQGCTFIKADMYVEFGRLTRRGFIMATRRLHLRHGLRLHLRQLSL